MKNTVYGQGPYQSPRQAQSTVDAEIAPGGQGTEAQDWPWGGVVDVPAVIEHEGIEEPVGKPVLYSDGKIPPGGRGTEVILPDAPAVEDILTVFAQWMRLDVADGNASPETLRNYMTDVRQHLEWLYEEGVTVPLADDDDLKAYRSLLVEKYAVSTVGRKLVAVRRFYEMAHARGIIPANPAARLKAPKDKTDRSERIKYFPYLAVKALLQMPMALHRDNDVAKGLRDKAMLVLMAMHGLRTVEIHRLDVVNFDPEAGETGTLRVLGKGDKYRTIYLTDESRTVLDGWLNARVLMRVETEAMFVSMHWGVRDDEEARHRMSRRAIRAMVDRYLRKADLKRPGQSCHSLRHSYATLSLNAGAKIENISDSMGHASITTTQVYAKIVDKARNNPTKLLGGLLDE